VTNHVVSGTLLSGTIHMGDTLLLGPDSLGAFTQCAIKGIQRKRVNVAAVMAGQSASLALKKIKRTFLRRGMVLVSREVEPHACWEFEAEVLVLYHSSVWISLDSPQFCLTLFCYSQL
jgi:GTPase